MSEAVGIELVASPESKRAQDKKESRGITLRLLTQVWVELFGGYFTVTVLFMSSYLLRLRHEITCFSNFIKVMFNGRPAQFKSVILNIHPKKLQFCFVFFHHVEEPISVLLAVTEAGRGCCRPPVRGEMILCAHKKKQNKRLWRSPLKRSSPKFNGLRNTTNFYAPLFHLALF